MPVQEVSCREQDASGYMEDDLEAPFGRDVTRRDNPHGQHEREKRPPLPVVPDARNHAPDSKQDGADYGEFGGFAGKKTQTHKRQERYQQRHGHAMDRARR